MKNEDALKAHLAEIDQVAVAVNFPDGVNWSLVRDLLEEVSKLCHVPVGTKLTQVPTATLAQLAQSLHLKGYQRIGVLIHLQLLDYARYVIEISPHPPTATSLNVEDGIQVVDKKIMRAILETAVQQALTPLSDTDVNILLDALAPHISPPTIISYCGMLRAIGLLTITDPIPLNPYWRAVLDKFKAGAQLRQEDYVRQYRPS